MSPSVAATPEDGFEIAVPILIIGGGAAGLIAALAASDAGGTPWVIEADAVPSGSTALSAGLIPAAGTTLQQSAGIEDCPDWFAEDIQRKAKGENPQDIVNCLAKGAAPTIEWLCRDHGLPFSVVEDFDYPGHARRRMHGLPTRSGQELVDALRSRCEARGIDILTHRRAQTLHHDQGKITGVTLSGPDGPEQIGCDSLILACNGYGGNRKMIYDLMPEIKDALWFGHDGNRGEAVQWGEALGADIRHLGAYQGHGNVAYPHGILITWATITAGGIQVNASGNRFWDESQGYSEAARSVLAQPGGVAWTIFDARIAKIARQFEDFKVAEKAGAVIYADDCAGLADRTGLPQAALAKTLEETPHSGVDTFGRSFASPPLAPPYAAAKVTGALFHTQGGLNITSAARVLRSSGRAFPNLFAAGGAALGVSGRGDSGYLSGNGLLSATVLGRIAGQTAAQQTCDQRKEHDHA